MDDINPQKESIPSDTLPIVQQPFMMIGTIPIYFQEDWTTGIGGGLWSTGLAMAQYLQDYSSTHHHYYHHHHHHHIIDNLERLFRQNQDQPLSILELGSGHGLLAVCWLALLATHQKQHWIDHLVITDTKEHLPLIQRTLDANHHLTTISVGTHSSSTIQITVMDHQWGVFQPSQDKTAAVDCKIISGDQIIDRSIESLIRQGRYQFDFIFGSDVAYHPNLYQPLLQSLQVFSNTNGTTIIMFGCTMRDTTPAFFDQAVAAGFRYERLAEHLLRPEFRGNFGIFCFSKNKERNSEATIPYR